MTSLSGALDFFLEGDAQKQKPRSIVVKNFSYTFVKQL